MKLLLDTHTFLWYLENNLLLPKAVVHEIENRENEVILSIASVWEMAIKINLGKLVLSCPFEQLETDLLRFEINLLPILFADTKRYLALPLHHRDPFDRMLIAQGLERDFIIASRDETFDRYGVNRFW